MTTFPDRGLLEQALSPGSNLLIVLDYLDYGRRREGRMCFCPPRPCYESGGIFINQEGRAQYSAPACAGGAPVLETGGGDHPPRVYGAGLPGADPQPAGQIMARLAGRCAAGGDRSRRPVRSSFANSHRLAERLG
ncbi:MAG: hypothetical protein MZV70_71515 [Desulfobacterales bacterium]|nr:hypothetical protein [Desulfobacterales bacterium]